MALPPDEVISPFLNVFKDGRLVDSFCLDSRDSFVLGRHTNCDVLLAHPSISRHHLEVQLLHATRELRLMDMDSVHGTWIDGMQIPSLTPHTVKEGVTIKLGASSRIYKVQWLHHPMPASSNERSITPEALDSNISKTGTVLACSTKSNDPCAESIQTGPLQPVKSLESSDSGSDNRRLGCILHAEGRPSPCCKHEAALPHKLQEIAPSGYPASGIETFNKNVSLQLTQQQQRKGKLPPLPPASRRIPFAPLSQNAESPTVKKKPTNAEKKLAEKRLEMESTNKLKGEGEENVVSGSGLWLRRCNSTPSPMLNTSASVLLPPALCPPTQASKACYFNAMKPEKAMPSPKGSLTIKTVRNVDDGKIQNSDLKCSMQQTVDGENELERQLLVNLQDKGRSERSDQEGGADQVYSLSNSSSFDQAVGEEEYPSDKENQEPDFYMGKQSRGGTMGTSSGAIVISRKPFQPLILTPNGDFKPASSPSSSFIGARDDGSIATVYSRPSSVVQNLDYMLQKLKGATRSEPRHEWHMVVDTTCLMDPNSFKCLKLLEGIKEVRLIIPQIVIRELDFSKGKDKGRMSSNAVLKWIESCMLKHPSWIHVQNFSENLPVSASTPPASPHNVYSASSTCAGAFGDLMSPTSGDRVLSCALVFSTTIFDGQVALLTNDTALKIKAMAEGIVCEEATTFCDSLLSPYSERFLWAGSIAHGPHWTEKPCHISTPGSPNSTALIEPSKRTFMSAARGMASKKHQVSENLRNHCKQAQGLKVILSK
eukprot:c5232_g1_i1 orf=313-2619(+)